MAFTASAEYNPLVRLLAGLSLCAVLAGACASCGVLAGIGGYTGELGELLDGAVGRGPDEGSNPPDSAEDGATVDDAPATDAPGTEDAEQPPPDDSGLTADAKPPCASHCANGCCTAAGDCAGSEQATACGTGGSACEDCTQSGQVCTDSACTAPKPDASTPPPPPPCTSSSCKNSCGGLQTACCNSSTHVCGCEYYWPSSCQ
jgi:hypothetical protein